MKQNPENNIHASEGIGKRLSEDGRHITREPSASLRERTLSAIRLVDRGCEVTGNQTTSLLLPRIRFALGAAAVITVGIVSVLLFKGETTVTDDGRDIAATSESTEISNSMNRLFAMTFFIREDDLMEQTLVKKFNTYTLAGRTFFDDAFAYLPQSIREQSENEDM